MAQPGFLYPYMNSMLLLVKVGQNSAVGVPPLPSDLCSHARESSDLHPLPTISEGTRKMTQQLRVRSAFAKDSTWFPAPMWQSGTLVPWDLMLSCDILGLLHTCDRHRSTHNLSCLHLCLVLKI